MEFESAKEDFRSVKQRLNDPGLEQASRASFDEVLKACDQAYEKYQRALIAFNERILTSEITKKEQHAHESILGAAWKTD
jgi:hypothetical protein